MSASNVSTSVQPVSHSNNLSNVQSKSIGSQTNTNKLHHTVDIKPVSNNGFVVGRLIIPKLGLNCLIRSDTVNVYHAVYHYSQSAAFGQPGECGLMGHRTTYSALFRHLDSLKIGDQVIIINLQQTKYTYLVTSNGKDIRWNYKTHPITFANSGSARLMLVTCHPPGTSRAAFITHCKLVSADFIPTIFSTTPKNLQTNISRTSTIAIKFNEKVKGSTYYRNIKIKCLKTNTYVLITKILRGNILYIVTRSKRLANTWYQVIIPKASMKDYTYNNLISTYSIKFKTGI